MFNYKKKLGDMLVEEGKITEKQLEFALRRQREIGKRIGEILIDDKIVTEEEIIQVLEKQMDIKRIDLGMYEIDRKAIKFVPENLARKHNLLPVGFKESKIILAMWDPLNIFAIDDVKIASGFEVIPFIAAREEIKKAIEKFYSDQHVQRAAEELSKEKQSEVKTELEELEFDDIKNAPVVKMVDYLVKNALELKASDIHIEPFEKYIKIRYRIDGELEEKSRLSKDTSASIITRIKILADLNIAEKRIPQDGRILTKIGNKDVDLRVSILPTVFGEKIVIRILNRDNYMVNRSLLGMNKEDVLQLDRIIQNPSGIILVTGPTGSGKSTTLYSILNDLNSENKNIITIEDPVEYMIEGINQVNVNNKAGLNFASGLRSILRQDPDIVMIGEMRDSETAQIAVRAAITGHIVLSTIHTNDAPSTVVRLFDMGIEPYLVATSISGVVAQRLVRKICAKCCNPYEASNYEKKILGISQEENLTLYKGSGCVMCNNTGYKGRRGVYEIMEMTKEHRELITKKASIENIRTLSIKNGMKTINTACRRLVIEGETTIDEMLKISFLD